MTYGVASFEKKHLTCVFKATTNKQAKTPIYLIRQNIFCRMLCSNFLLLLIFTIYCYYHIAKSSMQNTVF